MTPCIDSRRRQVLIGSVSAVTAAGLSRFSSPGIAAPAEQAKPLPGYADWKDADSVIVHSANTIETKRGELGTSVMTPGEKLFVRNNLNPPSAEIVANPDAWTISVEGVKSPRSVKVGDLKNMGVGTVAVALQCSGNGRGFFDHKASGTQWKMGAAGCVIWSGIPVAVLAENLGGPVDGVRFMTGTGGETVPQGLDPKDVIVERSVPLAAMKNALLAWEMNGEPVPLAHGGPLRLIVPGYYGVNNVKYIKRLAFTPKETDAKIHSSGYRVRPVGEKGAPTQPSMWEMNVKSWIDQPAGTIKVPAGTVQITGVAFAGTKSVSQVEVSTDGGKTWHAADFIGPDLGPYAWRTFVFPAKLAAGSYVLASRATGADGDTQPADRLENERGYANNSWRDHAVKVNVV